MTVTLWCYYERMFEIFSFLLGGDLNSLDFLEHILIHTPTPYIHNLVLDLFHLIHLVFAF